MKIYIPAQGFMTDFKTFYPFNSTVNQLTHKGNQTNNPTHPSNHAYMQVSVSSGCLKDTAKLQCSTAPDDVLIHSTPEAVPITETSRERTKTLAESTTENDK